MRPFVRIVYCSLVLSAFALAGCNPFSMAKTGYKTIKGASAYVLPLDAPSSSDLAGYDTIKLGEISTDVSEIVSSDTLGTIRTGMEKALADPDTQKLFPGGGKILTLNTVCRFFKEKPMIGKEARLDLLVSIVDAEAGRTVGRVYVEGINESMRDTKADDMATADTRKLIKYLKTIKTGKEENSEEEADKEETDKEAPKEEK